MQRTSKNQYAFLAWLIATICFCFLVLPQRSIPVFGDDFLLLRASGMYQGFGSNVELAFGQTGMEKYRPGFLVPYAILHQLFGENLDAYLIVNSILTFALGLAFGLVLKETTRLNNFAIPVGIVLISSMRFLWSSREWIFGLMEIIALLSCLLAIYFYLKSVRKLGCRFYMFSGNILFLVSIFTAERYVYVGIVFSIYLAFLKRTGAVKLSTVSIASPALLVFFNFAAKILVLHTNPLQGSLRDYQNVNSINLFSNMVKTFTDGLLKLSGFSAYAAENPYATSIRLVSISLILFIILLALTRLAFRQIPTKHRNSSRSDRFTYEKTFNVLLVGIGAAGLGVITLEPYADERFLVLTQLMAYILLINNTPRVFSNPVRFSPTLFIIVLLLTIEWSYLPAREHWFPLQNRAISIHGALEPYLNGSQPWRLITDVSPVIQTDIDWMLGYPNNHFVGIFVLSKNPPQSINGTDMEGLMCIAAELNEGSSDVTLTSC